MQDHPRADASGVLPATDSGPRDHGALAAHRSLPSSDGVHRSKLNEQLNSQQIKSGSFSAVSKQASKQGRAELCK